MSLVMYIKPGWLPLLPEARDRTPHKALNGRNTTQNDRERRKGNARLSDGDPTVPCIIQDGEYTGSGWGTPPRS